MVGTGLIIYFLQYHYSDDKSDEKWIYPFIWSVPCIAWLTGLFIQLGSTFKYEKPLLLVLILCDINQQLPIFSVISILALAFLCFIFYDASAVAQNNKICNSGIPDELLSNF